MDVYDAYIKDFVVCFSGYDIERGCKNLKGYAKIVKLHKNISSLLIDPFDLKNRKNCRRILSVEFSLGHDVICPSIQKYFSALGYEVDFLLAITPEHGRWDFFTGMDTDKKIVKGSFSFVCGLLTSKLVEEYDYVLFNTQFIFQGGLLGTNYACVDFIENFLMSSKKPKYGFLQILAHINGLSACSKRSFFECGKVHNIPTFSLSGIGNSPIFSPHIFSSTSDVKKRKKNIFLATGNINSHQKNHSLLFSAVDRLLISGITNFEVWVNGSGVLEVPEKFSDIIKFKGENEPPKLYEILESVDFIIACLDSSNEWQRLHYGTGTGSVAMLFALGYLKPYIVDDFFVEPLGFSSKNVIAHKIDELHVAMRRAIEMTDEEYLEFQENIESEQKRRYNTSLQSLRTALNDLSKSPLKHYMPFTTRARCKLRYFGSLLKQRFSWLLPKKRVLHMSKFKELLKSIPLLGVFLLYIKKVIVGLLKTYYIKKLNIEVKHVEPDPLNLFDKANKLGLTVKINQEYVDIINVNRVIRVNKNKHYIYCEDIINSFEYYFSAVIPAQNGTVQLVDYSLPKYHDVTGFDLHPIYFPSFAEPVVTTKQYCDFGNLKDGDTIIDLGGYSGLFAIIMKEIVGDQGRVITVEPDADNMSAIIKNTSIYHRITNRNIEILHGAAYNHSNGLTFSQEGNMGSSAVEYVGEGRGNLVHVPSFTLSKIAKMFSLSRVDFIKCDIEGAEAVVFDDDAFFHKFKPRIIIEAHYDFGKDKIDAGINKLKEYGYELNMIEQLGVSVPLVECIPPKQA